MLADLLRCRSIASMGLALAALAGFECRAQMSAPLVGLIGAASPSLGEIRPVLGVLGASSIQAPIQMSRRVSAVYLAPTGGWALVQLRQGAPDEATLTDSLPAAGSRRSGPALAQLGLVAFTGSEPGGVQPISNAAPNPSMVRFSPLGRSAALLASSTSIQVLTGLGSAPAVAFETGFYDPSGVKKLAVSDDGQLLAVLTTTGQVYMLGNSIAPALAYAASPASGIEFLPNQATAVIADAGNGTVNLVSMGSGAPSVRAVAAGVNFPGGETLTEASLDGESVVVVGAGGTSACRVDLATGAIQSTTLPAVATRLDRLQDGESFVFSAEPGRSAWFLTGQGSGLGAVFAAAAGGTGHPAATP